MEINNKSDIAYNLIKEKILTLDLEPGQPLKEVQLSSALNISRTPIREAMKRLASEGFIEYKDNQVNRVSDISLNQFIEIYQVREVLENLSVKLATFNWEDPNEIQELRDILDSQLKATEVKTINAKEFLQFDKLFHIKLLEMSRNKLLIVELKNVLDLYYRYNYFSIFYNRAMLTTMEHIDIIDAIESRNSRKAQQLMKSHLAVIRESIVIGLHNHP